MPWSGWTYLLNTTVRNSNLGHIISLCWSYFSYIVLFLLTICSGNINITYEEKALNCQDSGGVGAVIYHINDFTAFGSLGTPTKVTIPTYTITQANGIALQSTSVNSTVTIVAQMGYGYLSGTSMACPHVVGIVARIWRPVSLTGTLVFRKSLL